MADVTSEPKVAHRELDRIEHWQDIYNEGKAPWHSTDRHPVLADNIEVLFGDSGKTHKVLFPMCGKAVEMAWFAELGHSVVGIEAVAIPIKEFFSQNNLQYSVEDMEHIPGQLYKAEGVDLKIYCCDILDFSKDLESEFDAIWDRGAFGAIGRDDRRQYATLMSSLMTSDCQYITCVLYYGDKAREEAGLPPDGAPHNIPREQVEEAFASLCQVELLMKRPKDKNELAGKPVTQDIGESVYVIRKC